MSRTARPATCRGSPGTSTFRTRCTAAGMPERSCRTRHTWSWSVLRRRAPDATSAYRGGRRCGGTGRPWHSRQRTFFFLENRTRQRISRSVRRKGRNGETLPPWPVCSLPLLDELRLLAGSAGRAGPLPRRTGDKGERWGRPECWASFLHR